MAKLNKAALAASLTTNTARHNAAHQDTGFEAGREHTKLPVHLIDPNPYQPRTTFPEAEMKELINSIRDNGLLQPIIVRRADDRYQLIAGERRWRAHQGLAKTSIEAIISEATDEQMAVAAIVENIDRADLSDYEICKALRQAEALFSTKKAMATAFLLGREDMYKYLSFDALPDFVVQMLDINPRLLGRTAATEIKACINKHNGSPAVLECLRMAMDQVAAKRLDQSKVVARVEQLLRGEAIHSSMSAADPIKRGDVRIGSISKDDRNITIKLKTQAITESQESKLRAFLEKLVAERV